MISRIHEKLGTAGFVIAIVALIAALGGTALAAVGLNSKQKKEVTKIAKKYAGKNGAVGATGPQGPQGSKGDTGAQGNPGAPGKDGKNGVDGEDGEDGACSASVPDCVLPPGATLTGVYLTQQEGEGGRILVPISFPLRVEPNLFSGAANPYHFIGAGEPSTADCPGTADQPAAAPGQICLYSEGLANATDVETFQTGTSGFVREFQAVDQTARSTVRGYWAVTAPCPGGC